MNLLRHTISRINTLIRQSVHIESFQGGKSFSMLSLKNSFQAPLIKLAKPLVEQNCGFKVKYKLRRRCKDCYIVVRDSRKYIMCPTHPRHKQMSMVKKLKYTWRITHASQSKIRPW